MITPKFWARAIIDEDGQEVSEQAMLHGIHGIGWSNRSQQEAHQLALKRARKVRDWILMRDGDGLNGLEDEYYPDRVLREPVINELHHAGQRIAVVTQNVYGAYILNAERALFIDMDAPGPMRARQPKAPGFFARLFGRSAPPQEPSIRELDFPERVQTLVKRHAGMGLRLYKTPNGYRGLITNRTYQPGSDEAKHVLKVFEADTLYATLCEAQQCFRARLTAKPFRIGMDNPPRHFPFTDPNKQAVFDQWNASYESRCQGYAACQPLSTEPWGNLVVHPEVAKVMSMHDELACSPGKPLA